MASFVSGMAFAIKKLMGTHNGKEVRIMKTSKEKFMASKLNTTNKVSTRPRPRIDTTLLNLIRALNGVTDNDSLVVATATHLVNFGDTRRTGSLKNGRVVIG